MNFLPTVDTTMRSCQDPSQAERLRSLLAELVDRFSERDFINRSVQSKRSRDLSQNHNAFALVHV